MTIKEVEARTGLTREEAVLARDRDPVRIFPWRRYFARNLDLGIYTTLVTVILQLTAHMNFVRTGTLLPSLLGQIPVPLFALVSLGMDIWACWRVYHGKPLFWEGDDQLYLDGSTRERAFWDNNRNWLRAGGWLAATAACVGLTVGGHLLASLPPHRGQSITVEQFVDNYNRFMEFSYGKENLSWYLTESGAFEEVPDDSGAVIIHIWGESPVPKEEFRFTEEDGILIDSQARFTGYLPFSDDALFAQEGESQSYFVECSMRRTG